MKNYLYLLGLCTIFSCSAQTKKQSTTTSIVSLADSYYERLLKTFPVNAYYVDIELEVYKAG